MKHFNFLSKEQETEIFFQKPQTIRTKNYEKYQHYMPEDRQLIGHALGAALYMPATRIDIAQNIKQARYSATTYILCLEDSIGDNQVGDAEKNLLEQLKQLSNVIEQLSTEEKQALPMIFIRVRNPKHLIDFGQRMGKLLQIIDGFALPKATNQTIVDYMESVIKLSKMYDTWLWAMPILESREFVAHRTREKELTTLFTLLTSPEYEERILNIRLGATDICGLFGVRRTIDSTIYDVSVMKDFITSVLNYFMLDCRFVISGCVWEFFTKRPRMMKPLLRETPFKVKLGQDGQQLRKELITLANDGLIREVMLDKINGIHGKTCIHPTHITPINSQQVVPREEYSDAKRILEQADGRIGVFKSSQGNKMNEVKPHLLWAKQVLRRAEIFGVFNEKKEFVDLLIAEYVSEGKV